MRHIEDDHQTILFKWARFMALPGHPGLFVDDLMIHVPNGGKRNKREAGRIKAQGSKAGFPDVFLYLAKGGYHGLAIEMKKPIVSGQRKPQVSTLQKHWLEKLNEAGYKAVVCYGWDEAREVITEYINP